jgi:hypothetical protein
MHRSHVPALVAAALITGTALVTSASATANAAPAATTCSLSNVTLKGYNPDTHALLFLRFLSKPDGLYLQKGDGRDDAGTYNLGRDIKLTENQGVILWTGAQAPGVNLVKVQNMQCVAGKVVAAHVDASAFPFYNFSGDVQKFP